VTDRYARYRYAPNRYARPDRETGQTVGVARRHVLSTRLVQDSGTTPGRCRRLSVVSVTGRYARYRYARTNRETGQTVGVARRHVLSAGVMQDSGTTPGRSWRPSVLSL